MVLNVVVIGCFAVARRAPLRHVPMPQRPTRWNDLALRAGLVALLVGVVVTFSFRIGPTGSGILAVFPIVLSSIMIILHHRVGGRRRRRCWRMRCSGSSVLALRARAAFHRRAVRFAARSDACAARFGGRQPAELFRAPASGYRMTATLADPSSGTGSRSRSR